MPEPLSSIVIRCPFELQDILAAELWKQGIGGCEILETAADEGGQVEIRAYFPANLEPVPSIPSSFEDRVSVHSLGPVEDRDWLELFREKSDPIEIGEGFVVDPGPATSSARGCRQTLLPSRTMFSIPAERAFGTGSHESTRLAVEWLEELDLRNRTVLDVGTGSGILLMVCFSLGARSGLGFDVDPLAVVIADSNIRRNDLAGDRRLELFAGRLAAVDPKCKFEIVVANILPQRIRDELVRLGDCLTPDGELISSGHLTIDRPRAEADFAKAGLEVVGTKQAGEWVAYRLRADG